MTDVWLETMSWLWNEYLGEVWQPVPGHALFSDLWGIFFLGHVGRSQVLECDLKSERHFIKILKKLFTYGYTKICLVTVVEVFTWLGEYLLVLLYVYTETMKLITKNMIILETTYWYVRDRENYNVWFRIYQGKTLICDSIPTILVSSKTLLCMSDCLKSLSVIYVANH